MARRALTIIQLNDVHAYLEPHRELFWEADGPAYRTAGGYARIASLVGQIRKEVGDRLLFADNGDTFHGTYPAAKTKGEILVPVLARLGIHAMTAHWDFAYGPDILRKRVSDIGYPLLAANVFDKESGDLAFPPHVVIELGGVRVGIVGLASNMVDKTMPSHFSEGLRFTLGREDLGDRVESLRASEHVDLVVLLSHLGFPQDMKLAEEVKGIDVVMSGHTHNRLYTPAHAGDATVIQSGSHGSFLGRVDLEIDGGKIVGYRHQLVEVSAEIQPDPDLERLVNDLVSPFREELSEIVGETNEALHRYTTLESTMDNLLLSAILEATGAEAAFSNGWRYGVPVIPGPITLGDLYNIVPMNPPVSLVSLTGQEMLEMLEEAIESTFARDPYDQMGGYLKRAMGIKVLFKMENPKGHRIQKLFVGNQEVRPDREYSVAFVTVQGIPAKYGRNRSELPERAVEVMRRHLAGGNRGSSALQGTFLLV